MKKKEVVSSSFYTTEKKVKQRNNYIAEKSKEKKPIFDIKSLFNSISRYFRGVSKEIGRIKWTTGKDLIKYSIAAITFVVLFGVYFYGIDWIALLVRSLAN